MKNWLNKYKPNTLNEVLGDKNEIGKIETFIKQFTKKNNNPENILKPNIMISGMNGIGKTLITDIVLQTHNIEKIEADFSNVSVVKKSKKKKKTEKETINCNRSVKTYYKSLSTGKQLTVEGIFNKRNIALVIDDVSNISNPKEKEAIKTIIKLNNKLKEFPIIVITGTKHSKTVNELRKNISYSVKSKISTTRKISKKITNEIVLKAPSYRDMEIFTKKICNNEKMKLLQRKNDDEDIYVSIIEHAQFDIRRLINILEELNSLYPNTEITLDKFEQFKETSKKKDLDPGIYEATRILLNDYKNMESALTMYGEERATIPLMVHENYPNNIRYQYPNLSIDKQIDIAYNISKSISESDKIDGLIYSNQCWNLQPVHGFYSCALPSYYANKMPNKERKMETYKYTQDYNKTSIKKINNKVIKKAQEHQTLKKVSIYDFLYMSFILKILLERKDFETFANRMKPYGLKLKEIESIIKIDKIKKTKAPTTGKQRSMLKELLGVDE